MSDQTGDKKAPKKAIEKHLRIIYATITEDQKLNYGVHYVSGPKKGEIQNILGSGIIEPSLSMKMACLNIHSAIIDDVYKNGEIKVVNPESMHGDPLALLFQTYGFKIKGKPEGESVILIGRKKVTHGSMEFDTPRIFLDNISGYAWEKQLTDTLDEVRKEVELYMNGKYKKPDLPEKPDPNQKNIFDKVEEGK